MNDFAPMYMDLLSQSTPIESTDDLQRTEAWLEDRRGMFTGSKGKEFMSSGVKSKNKMWGDPEKTIDFGSAAEKYIYSVGMERNTGLLSMKKSAKQMDHGTTHEPLLIQQLLKDGVVSDIEELGFERFKEWPTGGASVDGRCIYVCTKERVGLEIKCTVSWDGHYDRMYEPIHDKHKDFWQFQFEMLSLGINKLLYVVAYPMQVEKYDVTVIHASPVHQRCIIERCKIADAAIDLWSEYPRNKGEALRVACANYSEQLEIN